MTLTPEARDRVNTYLWEVAGYLHALSPSARVEVLRDLESHICEALAARGETPTPVDVETVLADLPAPPSYADGAASPPPHGNGLLTWNEVPGAFLAWWKRFAWEGLVGIVLLLFGIILVIRGFLLTIFADNFNHQVTIMGAPALFRVSTVSLQIIGIFILLLGFVSLLLARFTGRNGLQRIATSHGALSGFSAAFIAFIVPQVLIFDGLIFIPICLITHFGTGGMAIGWIVPITLIILLDILLVRHEWRVQLRRLEATG